MGPWIFPRLEDSWGQPDELFLVVVRPMVQSLDPGPADRIQGPYAVLDFLILMIDCELYRLADLLRKYANEYCTIHGDTWKDYNELADHCEMLGVVSHKKNADKRTREPGECIPFWPF